ncbi:hypothetical protein [Rathayibacter iranicus]|uniref:Uncharacterized protein n=2 Tax=Rathayibacter iranicus TaxID=59737 RepID=A0AAD1AE58_9MICO|nr:hypothetical protein [Rathayibacter iranicus]AZZ56657.1 hypothetical protein C7V51_12815 [Rathayibacter iranicus]MWV31306.1 hypothetical protein [Rathayibacter iranicus NCPPB 2253 = VKM Ac-1602]PPI43302.1 hypothetical protein C5E09_11735 [Rathayibacter iranicus]PPI58245.1 hypothetical protein C5E08_12650 [Rathayibacter iranicus]PPI69458.1 hypothetical protein C5E01_11695 [Rathayibacter iranicus]
MPKKTRDVIVASSDWTVPSADGVHRRTIVKGAAWTVPVVAVAMATPAAAASEAFVCPTVPASSGWTKPVTSGTSTGPGVYEWSTDGTEWQNTKDSTKADSFSYYIEFSFKGVAGHSYTFNWSAYASGARNTANYAAYDVTIGGNQVYTASTDGNYGGGASFIDPNTKARVSASKTFTPTTDGTYTFRYTVRLSQLASTQDANHDVWIKMPTLTCS